MFPTNNEPQSRLLLSAREAATSLAVSSRTLWSITFPRGELPCVRIGSRVLYARDDLDAYIAAMRQGSDK